MGRQNRESEFVQNMHQMEERSECVKRNMMNRFITFGKKYHALRYPVLIGIIIFLLMYNMGGAVRKGFWIVTHTRPKPARVLASVLALIMLVNSASIPTFAAEDNGKNFSIENTDDITTLCSNHQTHDESCGYVEASEEVPCQHEHGDECYSIETVCQHEHNNECYEIVDYLVCDLEEGSGSENDENITSDSDDGTENNESGSSEGHTHSEACYAQEQNLICSHVCSEESGCVICTLNCQHVHDDTCGYQAAVEGHACEHVCELCNVNETEEEVVDNEKEDKVVFEQTVVCEDIEIYVIAPAGVFPVGARLCVEMITNENEISEIEQMVAEKKNEETEADVVTVVEQSYSFDITIENEDGEEIQPDATYGEVSVEFKNVGACEAETEEEKELSVFYVSDDCDEIEELDHDVNTEEDSASITAEHFSIYTVVITKVENTIPSRDYILHYYQGVSQATSYFTIYDGKELLAYRDLVNDYQSGELAPSDKISTILVNSDDNNPIDGITGVGQSKDMTVSDLNFSAKIMDDIVVTDAWSPITRLYEGATIDGAGHTIEFRSLENNTSYENTSYSVLLGNPAEGAVKNIKLVWPGGEFSNLAEQPSTEKYATVTIRVDGKKAEIGEAITGAEALAVSADGENYITLERDDDLAVYKTLLENLYPPQTDDSEEEGAEGSSEDSDETENGTDESGKAGGNDASDTGTGDDEKVYSVYYVYEDENETISAAEITKSDYEAELNYVSVTYDLEGANTYKELSNGELSENVMAAIRVDVNEDGSCTAQEDYNAVVKAAPGFEIPTKEKNVIVSVNGAELSRNSDYSYEYDTDTKLGKIEILKDKITGPVHVKVKADSLEDNPPNRIILITKGGYVGNTDIPWEKEKESTYVYNSYEGGIEISLPKADEMQTYKGSDAIAFGGWYTDINCSGEKINTHVSQPGKTNTYYAKWVLNKTSNTYSGNSKVKYSYKTYNNSGVIDVKGEDGCQVTWAESGFQHVYSISANPEGSNGTNLSLPVNKNDDIFKRIYRSNDGKVDIWVAAICTYDESFLDISYIFENRGTDEFTSNLHFGTHADVKIAGDDYAIIREEIEGNATYLQMAVREGQSNYGKAFRLYISCDDQGVDQLTTYWYGGFSTRYDKVFTNNGRDGKAGIDSALAFSWSITNIPAGDYVTRTTRMGLASTSNLNTVSAKLIAGEGRFADTKDNTKTVTSTEKTIKVLADGRIQFSSNQEPVDKPIREGWRFDHWSIGKESGTDATGRTFTDSVTLYANWIPQPDKAVTNNCSVQKVNGSDSLLVPEALGNIVLINTTPGAAETNEEAPRILQGQTADKAAGYASGFSCVLSMEGEDDRYLLPDNIEVTVTDDNGNVQKLTKDTGYTYSVYDNRKKASLDIRKQFINGDITVTAVGYELPPLTATKVDAKVALRDVSYGERAVLTATAETSKNHVASYQWYIAPYYYKAIDSTYNWTYQNQEGIKLENGTYVCENLNSSGKPITIMGANKATMRISGLDVQEFIANPGEDDFKKYDSAFLSSYTPNNTDNLTFGGYHFYCVVTSTRNITGQEVVTVSDTVEFQVVQSAYSAPTGLIGSATTYKGMADGSIFIENQPNRPKMQYAKTGSSTWKTVSDDELEAGQIIGLEAGEYRFKYVADSNHTDSEETLVTVASGRDILVTYRALGCDEESLRTQYKHVAYNSDVTANSSSTAASDEPIQNPEKTNYEFVGWNPAIINGITADTVVDAVYRGNTFAVTLDSCQESLDGQGTTVLYERYSEGFYKDEGCTALVNGSQGIDLPTKAGYKFLGYFTEENGGVQKINADGCLSENVNATEYDQNSTGAIWYAHWAKREVDFQISPGVSNSEEEPGGGTDNGISVDVKPADPEEADEEGFKGDINYFVTITNDTGKDANVIYIYSDGKLKRTLINIEFDENNQYTFELIPDDIGGGEITFVVGYVNPTKENGDKKGEDELLNEAEEQAGNHQYQITYKDVNGTTAGADFSGSFLTVAPEVGIVGVPTGLPEVAKTGYTFGGWYTAPRGTGTAITEVSASKNENVTVYAKWIANKYPLFLDTNGGLYAIGYVPADQYQHNGSDVLLPNETQVMKDNYAFLGWFDNAECIGNPVEKVDTSRVGSVTYYAGWEPLRTYTVTLATNNSNSEKEYEYAIEGEDGQERLIASTDTSVDISVYDGEEYQFKVKATAAYAIKAVKANGKLILEENGSYKIAAVTDNIKVTVETEKLTCDSTNAIATIQVDESVLYFDSVDAAIYYSAKYGNEAVITLNAALSEEQLNQLREIDAIAGSPYSIDFNGNTLPEDSRLLIEDGAEVTLKDSADPQVNQNNLFVENRGGLTNETIIGDLLNLGITNNDGTVSNLTQQGSETYDKSKFVNKGTLTQGVLESGYYVENGDPQDKAPEGLTGYNTIMNGNEYYVDFKDAVDLANASESDATILVLATVDNHKVEEPIQLKNQNGKSITVDWNGNHFVNGTLETFGNITFKNGKGSTVCYSEIKSYEDSAGNTVAAVKNHGDLLVEAYVKIAGTLENESDGTVTVQPNAVVSGPLNNRGMVENNGTITGIVTNETGSECVNNGTMNNVIQKGGEFQNNGTVQTKIDMQGGTYETDENGLPKEPEGAVAKSNTTPVKYYGDFKEAVEDANQYVPSEDNPESFEITILDDIPDEKLGEAPIVLNSTGPVSINLNNHQLGDGTADPEKTIQIGKKSGTSEENTTVTIKNEPENGEDANSESGKVQAPVEIGAGGKVSVEDNVTASDIDNSGDLTTKSGSKVEKLTNTGNTDNNGTLGDVTQEGGTLKNNANATISSLTQNGGNTENNGTVDNLTQNGGDTENNGTVNNFTQYGGNTENKGTVEKLTQNGGTTDNQGIIKDADITNGAYTGTQPEILDGAETGEQNPDEGKTGKIVLPGTPPDGDKTIYFVTLQDALNYAANCEAEDGVTVTLLKDVTSEQIEFTGIDKKTPVTLDLNGKNIGTETPVESSITIGENANLKITDNNGNHPGIVKAPITNKGTLEIASNLTVEGNIENAGELTNNGTISGEVTNTGSVTNNGTVSGDVTQNDGSYVNKSGASTGNITQNGGEIINEVQPDGKGIDKIDLKGGSFRGTPPASGVEGAVAQIGDKLYGDLESAVEDANQALEAVTIKLLDDVTLSSEEGNPLVIDNQNGKNITLNLQGKDIVGGNIQVGSDSGTSGSVAIQDTSVPEGEEEKGTVSSPVSVKKNGSLQVGDGVTVSGNIDNDGTLTNNGKTGDITNNGSLINNGTTDDITNTGKLNNNGQITGTVEQKDGTLTNGENGTIQSVKQTGGVLNNQNTSENGGIENASISGGEYNGNTPTNTDYEGAQAAVITKEADGTEKTTYYPTLKDAVDAAPENATINLLKDVTGEPGQEIVIQKPGITIDLQGNEIGSASTITIASEATDTEIVSSGSESEDKGKVSANIENNGGLTLGDGVEATDVSNKGELDNKGVIDKLDNSGTATNNGTVKQLDNSGSATNNGAVNKLNNSGSATNNGTISELKQTNGEIINQVNGSIDSITLTGGSYEGIPSEALPSEDQAVAQIGDRYYFDLESALEDAKKASEDVTVKLLQDIETDHDLQLGGNENDKKITLDLNGKTIESSSDDKDITIQVTAPGECALEDSSSDGSGAVVADVKVEDGATLEIEPTATIQGDIDNQGKVDNQGTIIGDVENQENGTFQNAGDILGGVENEGDFTNEGIDSYIGGDFTNEGHLKNEGVITGEVDNSGEIENTGNIDNNVTNRDNAHFDNDGNVNGQLENKENATTDNSGYINQVKQTGGEVENSGEVPDYLMNDGKLTNSSDGKIAEIIQNGGELTNGSNGTIEEITQNGGELINGSNGTIVEITQNGGELTNSAGGTINQLTQTDGHTENAGTINTVETTDIKNFNGNKPSEGLSGADASVTYIDENGKEKTEYFATFDEAMEKAAESNRDGTTPTTITLVTSPFVVDKELTIPEGVTLEVPEGNTLQITENGKVINQGTIQVDEGAGMEIEEGGSLTNQSTMVNNGTLENAGELKNESQGTIQNTGDISNTETGEITNEGQIDNKNGSLNGSDDSAGNIINNGSIAGGTVSGPLENGVTGVISGSDKLQGEIKNEGTIEVSSGQVSEGANIENLPGSSFVNIEETNNQNNKPGDTTEDNPSGGSAGDNPSDGSAEDDSSDNDTTNETVVAIKNPLELSLQISEAEEDDNRGVEIGAFNYPTEAEEENIESEEPADSTESEQDTFYEENLVDQEPEAENKPISIQNLDEAEGIIIVKNQVVTLGRGTVEFEVESTACNVKADLKMLLQSCFTEEELKRIEEGENAVLRVSVVKVADTVSEQDKNVVEEQMHILEKTIKGLQFGQYLDIYVECKIGDSEWRQVHELSGDMVLEIIVPDELLKGDRIFYILRNHEGVCELLEDLDDEPTTVTIATNKFSTYALLYVDSDTTEEAAMEWIWFLLGGSVLLLFFIFLFLKRKKEEK